MKELICKVLGLRVPLLELSRFGILLGELGVGQIEMMQYFSLIGLLEAEERVGELNYPYPVLRKIHSKGLTSGDNNNDGDHPETFNTSPPIPLPTQQIPHIVSSIKLPILKKGEYDIWAMKMEHYLSHTDYPIWQVIHNGNGYVSVTTDTNGIIKVLPPKTAEEVVAREMERKERTTLLMALPEDHLAKFHKMADAKEM
nr:ribonuclease H-like domain-containing protein [Tanacetum cinerariifolium]